MILSFIFMNTKHSEYLKILAMPIGCLIITLLIGVSFRLPRAADYLMVLIMLFWPQIPYLFLSLWKKKFSPKIFVAFLVFNAIWSIAFVFLSTSNYYVINDVIVP